MTEEYRPTFYLDNDYDPKLKKAGQTYLGDLCRREFSRRGIPYETDDINAKDHGDFMFVGLDGIISGEIKGAGEYISDIDHAERQLFEKQIPNCDVCCLCIYGRMEPAPDGMTYVYGVADGERIVAGKDPKWRIERYHQRFDHRHNYLGIRTKLARYRQLGIDVYESVSLQALVADLVAIYTTYTTVGKTGNRLIPENFIIREADKPKRDFMLSLMGIQGAGVGPELAEAIFNWVNQSPMDISIAGLIWCIKDSLPENAPGYSSLADFPMPSGKRKVGPAAAGKLRSALGV